MNEKSTSSNTPEFELISSNQQIRQEKLNIYMQAASDLGNVVVTVIARDGEQFDPWPGSKVPHNLIDVSTGNVAVNISGLLDPEYALSPLYERVREIEAKQVES